jgi:hypothetical protein
MENKQFEVAYFKTTYNALLGWLAPLKFMSIFHYAYLVLKMLGPHGVISINGDVKWAFDCDRESYETTDRLLASAELQDLKQAMTESPPPTRSCPRPRLLRCPSSRRTHSSRKSCCPQRNLQGGSCRQQFGSQIGIHTRPIPLGIILTSLPVSLLTCR